MDYKSINRTSWNNRLEAHLNSEFYDVKSFLDGRSSLNQIELDLLGDVSGKSILHLQCHFGQDSISLARMGAEVTGVDLSDKAIDKAKEFAQATDANCQFICCDIYDLPQHLEKQFDIVFTTYGTIGWLPDMDRWAGIVSRYLKPDGRFIFVEFHPVVWMYDDDFTKISYSYFNQGIIHETEEGTYADKEADITQEFVSWNHPLSEVFTSLSNQGLTLQAFQEYDYSPYHFLGPMTETSPGKYMLTEQKERIPLVYSLVYLKK